MPRLPVLSGAKLVSVLVRSGFAVDRQRGSHVVLKRADLTCIVPLHRELKRATLAGMLEQAGLSREDLIAAL